MNEENTKNTLLEKKPEKEQKQEQKQVENQRVEKREKKPDAGRVINDYNAVNMKQINRYGVQDEQDNVPAPHGAKARFYNFTEKFGDLFVLNLIFFLTLIPVITIADSFTSLYAVTMKMVENKEGPVVRQYFREFKRNFKSTTRVWLVNLGIFAILSGMYYYTVVRADFLSKVFVGLIGLGMLFFTFELPLLFPMMARYENTTWNYIKNAVVLSVSRLGLWFRTFFFWVFPPVIYKLRPVWLAYTWYLWVMILFSAVAYWTSMYLIRAFRELEDELENNQSETEAGQ